MSYDMDLPEMPKGRHGRPLLWVALVVVALAILTPLVSKTLTEWLWYAEQQHTEVYWTMFWGQWALGIVTGLLFFALVFGNAVIALRNTTDSAWYRVGQLLRERAMFVLDRTLRRGAFWASGVIALLFAWLLGMTAAGYWPQFLLFLTSTPTGQVDPIFHHDVGFYMFKLPVWELLNGWLSFTLIFALLLTGVVYLITRAIYLVQRRPAFTPAVLAHLSVLAALLLICKAVNYYLARFGLLFSETGLFSGPGFTDAHGRIPGLMLMACAALVAAGVMLVNIKFRRVALPLGAIVGLLALSFLVTGVYPSLVQRFRVEPNELELETPYLKNHIRMTREAYGLDRVRQVEFPATQQVTNAELASSPVTVNNIRLWDHRPLSQTYRQRQELRPYYQIENVDIDRYHLGGQMRQVMLAAREMNIDKDTNNSTKKSWINRHLIYTHGYGLVMSPVNAIDPDKGHPIFFVSDIPPSSTHPELAVKRPELYFGELDADYIVVRTKLKEFDYPTGDTNAVATYEGTAGIPLTNPLVRALMAWQFKAVNLLISDYVTPDSRLVFRRQIVERAQALAPFLYFDQDPYLVIGTDGHLYWMLDAYTRSARYPYSRYSELEVAGGHSVRTNYLRNPVKVVVDAYNGTTQFYLVNGDEPFINAWKRVFPRLFQPLSAMPAGLAQHIRVPEGLFNTVSDVYRRYHMTVPRTFYQNEDPWNIPPDNTLNEVDEYGQKITRKMPAYYLVMSMPGKAEPEYLLIRPYTPSNKQNMISWLSARNDPDHLGEMQIFNFPKQRLVFGPEQIEAQINQDTEISSSFTLWGQAGSNVLMGNLMVIPVGTTVLYVQPVYLQANQSQLPELQRVIVADQERIYMRRTLDEALAALTQGKAGAMPSDNAGGTTPPDTAMQRKARTALEHYNRAIEAQRQGDWATFGKEMDAVRKELEGMGR